MILISKIIFNTSVLKGQKSVTNNPLEIGTVGTGKQWEQEKARKTGISSLNYDRLNSVVYR